MTFKEYSCIDIQVDEGVMDVLKDVLDKINGRKLKNAVAMYINLMMSGQKKAHDALHTAASSFDIQDTKLRDVLMGLDLPKHLRI